MLKLNVFKVRNPYDPTGREFTFSCPANDEFVAGWMKHGWIFEPFNLHVLGTMLKPGSVVLDVGAHIGTYAVVLGTTVSKCRIYSFEPQGPVYSVLLKNLELNRVENCTPFNLGVAHRQLMTSMQRAVSDGTGAGRAVSYNNPRKYNFAGLSVGLGQHVVACVSLDEFASKALLKRIDLLKIDVEGAEPYVFYGSRAIIRKFRPIIHFEENDKRVTSEMARGLGTLEDGEEAHFIIRRYVRDMGYRYFRLPFDNVMLVPHERTSRSVVELFDLMHSDSEYFDNMHVFRRDRYSPGSF